MKDIKLISIEKNQNQVIYKYELSKKMRQYINGNELNIEYDEDITTVPESILVVPFLCNMLPIIWVIDASIEVKEIDKSFYESINESKKGYEKMYPNISFKGEIHVKDIVLNKYDDSKKSVCFFTGGVDATNTLITHIEERPITITLWGADIKINNEKGWKNVKKHIIENTPGIENRFIKSTFRDIMNEKNLNELINKFVSENWWHGFQHGIGLIGHVAPFCYLHKITKVYIASTFTKEDIGVTCASDPTIDNFVRFGSTRIYHDGYEFTRQEKIKNICNYNKQHENKFKLRVCYMTDEGNNCNECEKCIRTIMAIKANGDNPKEYGFSPDYDKIKFILKNKCYFDNIIYPLWKDILNEFNTSKEKFKKDNEINWIFDIDLNSINKKYKRIDKRVIRVLKRKFGKK